MNQEIEIEQDKTGYLFEEKINSLTVFFQGEHLAHLIYCAMVNHCYSTLLIHLRNFNSYANRFESKQDHEEEIQARRICYIELTKIEQRQGGAKKYFTAYSINTSFFNFFYIQG